MLDQATMAEAVDAFGAKLKANGGVGLFYFSGHGAQIGGENYLIPVERQCCSGGRDRLGDGDPDRQRHGRRA